VTVAALAFARFEVDKFDIGAARYAARSGLLGSDAAWYLSIARHGYHETPEAGLRFFPLFPGVGRLLHSVTFVPVGGALVIVANLCALLATMLLVLLVESEFRDPDLGRRVAWLFSLFPASFACVMGYAEGLFLVCAIATFLSLRRQRWWWAALWAFAAGLTRPFGLLLVVPIVIEAGRGWRASSSRSKFARVGAAVAPMAGLASFLVWVEVEFGDFLAPIRLHREGQTVSVNPFVNAYHDVAGLLDGSRVGSGLHLPWIVLALTLCVVAFRRLPASFGAYALCVVVAGLAGNNFESFERYAFSAFPLIIAGATLTRSRRVEVPVLALSAVAMFGYACLAFLGAYIP
jgi:hypothetical protein